MIGYVTGDTDCYMIWITKGKLTSVFFQHEELLSQTDLALLTHQVHFYGKSRMIPDTYFPLGFAYN